MFVCQCVCVFVSYIPSMTVQKHDTPLAVWHLATQRARMCTRAHVYMCVVCARGKEGGNDRSVSNITAPLYISARGVSRARRHSSSL